mmetsp:Transcript_36760/g.91583  ORF Transcript_36760/g.91583 Transcript_36760/m.91583 type:complete len:387 (-) Transcript_36760:206-1366(-)
MQSRLFASRRQIVASAGSALGTASSSAAATTATPMPAPAPLPDDGLSAEELRAIKVFQDSCDSVVFVTRAVASAPAWLGAPTSLFDQPGTAAGSGSGFVWDEHGHIVTNHHVVKGATELTVTTGSQEVLTASVVGIDADRDIAVLRVHTKTPLRALPLGSSGTLRVGQRTLAIGCPFGLDFTLTTGVVSGLGRDMLGRTGRPITGCIQTDAALNPGSSGGPLLDSSGRVIGVNTAIMTTSGSSAGVGMSIPVDAVRLAVDQIIARGFVLHPSIGVRMAPDHFVQHQLGVRGVLVVEVQPGSGADHAGLRRTSHLRNGRIVLGDLIVTLNGKEVKNSLDLFKAMDGAQIGDAVELELATLADDGAGKLREKSRRKATVKINGLASKL